MKSGSDRFRSNVVEGGPEAVEAVVEAEQSSPPGPAFSELCSCCR